VSLRGVIVASCEIRLCAFRFKLQPHCIPYKVYTWQWNPFGLCIFRTQSRARPWGLYGKKPEHEWTTFVSALHYYAARKIGVPIWCVDLLWEYDPWDEARRFVDHCNTLPRNHLKILIQCSKWTWVMPHAATSPYAIPAYLNHC